MNLLLSTVSKRIFIWLTREVVLWLLLCSKFAHYAGSFMTYELSVWFKRYSSCGYLFRIFSDNAFGNSFSNSLERSFGKIFENLFGHCSEYSYGILFGNSLINFRNFFGYSLMISYGRCFSNSYCNSFKIPLNIILSAFPSYAFQTIFQFLQ